MKLKHKVVNLTIPAGDDYKDVALFLDEGKVIACALHTDNSPSSNVNVKLEDSNSNELHPFVSHKEYQPTNGNHFESRKSIHFSGGREVKVFAKSSNALTEEFNFQLIFYIDQTKS